jgi:hypothetical protein
VELDGQEVISAISKAIRPVFTTTEFPRFYKDTPKEGMQKPCIFFGSVNFNHTPEMRDDARWHFIVEIRCHPAETNTEIETWARGVLVKLLGAITRITISNQVVKATNIESTTREGILQVLATYSFGVVKTLDEEANMMDTVEYGTHIK